MVIEFKNNVKYDFVRPFNFFKYKVHIWTRHVIYSARCSYRRCLCPFWLPLRTLLILYKIIYPQLEWSVVCCAVAYQQIIFDGTSRVRLPIMLISAEQRKLIFPCPRSRLRIWSLERVRQSRPASACSSPYESGAYLRDSSRVPRQRPFVYLEPPYAIGSVPSPSGHASAYRWRSLPRVRRHGASKPQGSSERVLPWQVIMDQVMCLFSHTH